MLHPICRRRLLRLRQSQSWQTVQQLMQQQHLQQHQLPPQLLQQL